MRLQAVLISLRGKLQDELKEYGAAARTRTELAAKILQWSECLEKNLGQGSAIRPVGSETSFFNLINILSLESGEYEKETAKKCDAILSVVQEDVKSLHRRLFARQNHYAESVARFLEVP